MPKYNQTKVNAVRKPTVTDKMIEDGVLEFLEMKAPGPLTSYWEVKRAAEAYVKYHLKYHKDSMNSEMFEGISMDKMRTILNDMRIAGKIGWAMESRTTWGAHYYLPEHSQKNPEISVNWTCSEYKNGKESYYRDNMKVA